MEAKFRLFLFIRCAKSEDEPLGLYQAANLALVWNSSGMIGVTPAEINVDVLQEC